VHARLDSFVAHRRALIDAIPTRALPFAAFAMVALDATEAGAVPHQVCHYLDLGADICDASPRARRR
jgi:hypothetical protein